MAPKQKPYSIEMYKKHFNIDLLEEFEPEKNYYFNETEKCNLMVLKFECIKEWEKLINELLPFHFELTHSNKTPYQVYDIVKETLKFTEDEFNALLTKTHRCFYSEKEIEALQNNFMTN